MLRKKGDYMAQLIQLDFFEATEFSVLKARIEEVRESGTKVRKKLFAENGDLKRRMMELESRMEVIERHLCKGSE